MEGETRHRDQPIPTQCSIMEELQKLNTNMQQTQREIVEFTEEGALASAAEQKFTYPLSFSESCMDKKSHTVIDFLSRPIEGQNFTWNTSQAAGQELGVRTLLPEDWLSVSMIRDKLTGFQFLKCGFKIRVQVNAMPFHQGRLLVVFDPLFQQTAYLPTNIRHFGGVTGYHHVDLDLSQSTGAELVIPYRSNVPYFDVVRAIGHLGTVRLFVYSQLRGPTSVEGTIWIEATDIEVQMPTGVSPFPRARAQSNAPPGQGDWSNLTHASMATQAEGTDIDAPEFEYADDEYYEGEIVIPQNAEAKEQAQPEGSRFSPGRKGWGERFFQASKGVCNALVGVPALGLFAPIGSWLSDLGANVCALYGWSKPRDPRTNTKFIPHFGADMMNFDGDSKAKVLALDSRNRAIIPAETFGTQSDEMVLSHILARPTYLARFTLSTTQVPNQLIWKWPVSPSSCYKTTVNNNSVKLNTYLSYLAEMFAAWRGGIKYHFKIVKTRFHSTRVRVFFVPGVFEDTDTTIIDPNKIYSKVIDIRNLTSFDFEVPYVYNQPWMSTKEVTPLRDQISESLPTGMLYVEVLNTLVAGGQAADTIEFIVETSAGEDFQFGYHDVHSAYGVLPSLDPVNAFMATTKDMSDAVVRKIGEHSDISQISAERAAGLTGSALAAKIAQQAKQRMSANIVVKGKDGKNKILSEAPKSEKTKPIGPAPSLPEKKIAEPTTTPVLPACPLPLWTSEDLPVVDVTPQGDESIEPTHVYDEATRKKIWQQLHATHLKGNKFAGLLENPLWHKYNRKYPAVPDTCSAKAQSVSHVRSHLFANAFSALTQQNLLKARAQSNFFSTKRTKNLTPNMYGLGEAITSLRQIMKRYTTVGELAVPATGSASYFFPYLSAGYFAEANPKTYHRTFDRIASLYRWQCGSRRVGITSAAGNEPTAHTIVVNSLPGFESFSSSLTSSINQLPLINTNRNIGFSVSYPKVEKFIEYQIPFYQRVPAIPTSVGKPVNSDLDQLVFGNDYVPTNNGAAIVIAHTQPLILWEAIGEDFSYGYLLGVPLSARPTV